MGNYIISQVRKEALELETLGFAFWLHLNFLICLKDIFQDCYKEQMKYIMEVSRPAGHEQRENERGRQRVKK